MTVNQNGVFSVSHNQIHAEGREVVDSIDAIEHVLQRYTAVRNGSQALVRMLNDEDMVIQSMPNGTWRIPPGFLKRLFLFLSHLTVFGTRIPVMPAAMPCSIQTTIFCSTHTMSNTAQDIHVRSAVC